MSDNLVRYRQEEVHLGGGDVEYRYVESKDGWIASYAEAKAALDAQAAEITRLRAELATARLQPTLNPDRWRGAINDALIKTGWLDPIREDEVPKDALDRLINFEVQVSLDQKTSERIEDMIFAARREGMEQAAKIAENHPDLKGAELLKRFSQVTVARGTNIFTKREIAAAIRAAAKEGK